VIVVSHVTEMNEQRNNSARAVDFIELISQDLPWDDIDRALGDQPDQLAPTITCSPAEHEFNPDDLSLFNAFANSLPSLACSHTNIKANSSSLVRAEEPADTGTDLAQDVDTDLQGEDFDCPDEISLSSQMEEIMADILNSSVAVNYGEKQPVDNDNEQVCNERGDCSMLQLDDNGSNSDVHEEKTELPCSVKSSYAAGNKQCRMNAATGDAAECRSAVNGTNSNVNERNKEGDDDCRRETQPGEKLDGEQCNRCQDCNDNNDDNADGDDMTASQEWVYDQLHTHLIQQHDEASRLNSLRVRLPPPPGTSSVPRDFIGRAVHAFTTEVEVMKLDVELTSALLADNPNISHCCKLLDDFNPHELSPGVLVQYPFFAGTVDVCCRWEGDLADELHATAHCLRAFMMAMYARHSVDEGFITALNRQVQHCCHYYYYY